MRTKRHSRLGFTLVELMIVIGIMGMLMLIAIPAFQGANRGGRMRTAIFQLNATFGMARQNAITTRQETYVLLPDDDPNLYANAYAEHVENAFRSYAVYGVNDGYIGEWRVLPTGILFDPDYEKNPPSTSNIFRQESGVGTKYLVTVPYPDMEAPDRSIYAIGFRIDGPLHVGGAVNGDLFLREGWTEYDKEAGTFGSWNAQPDAPIMYLQFHAVTGQSKIREILNP